MLQKLKSIFDVLKQKVEPLQVIPETLIYSFDVFDTLITRKYADSRDPIRIACIKVAKKFQLEWQELFHLRMFVEERTREDSQKEDISFEEIYDALRKNYSYWKDVWNELQQLEWEKELESVQVVWENFHLFHKLKKENRKLILVSDMYLRKTQIMDLLQQCNYDLDNVEIYVSSEIGLAKYTGNLYKHIAENLKLNEKILHIGDNWNSDVLKAQENKIEAKHFIETHLHEAEKNLFQNVEWSETDSLFVGLLRRNRLEYFQESLLPKDKFKSISDFTSIILFPFLLSFVLWLKQNKKPKEKLYFIARDGHFLYEIYKTLFPEDKVDYLHGSRQAWFLPCMNIESQEDYDWLFLKDHPRNWKYLANKLELPLELKNQISEKFSLLDTTELTQKKLQEILLDNEFTSSIQTIIKERRKRLISYLHYKQVGQNETAFVDLGWTLKTVSKINKLLKTENLKPVSAYFVSCFYERVPSFLAGDTKIFLNPGTENLIHVPNSHLFWSKSRGVEQVLFLPSEKSTVDYAISEKEVKPLFKEELLIHKNNQETILKTIQRFAKLLKESEIYKKLSFETLKRGSFENIIHFLEGRYPYWLEVFSDYKISIDPQTEEFQSLGEYLKN
ncbi:MAG: HAD-IA family hydrolase [Leptospiraceae bacterium]|nr:HAD-IA family hydrolase [Leptospiraceae bacterium]